MCVHIHAQTHTHTHTHTHIITPIAIAAAVSHWQELKVQGKLDQVEEKEEEDIYAAARIGQVILTYRCTCTMYLQCVNYMYINKCHSQTVAAQSSCMKKIVAAASDQAYTVYMYMLLVRAYTCTCTLVCLHDIYWSSVHYNLLRNRTQVSHFNLHSPLLALKAKHLHMY